MSTLEPIAVALVGLCVGSFIGVVADRLPAGEPLVWTRSACAGCGRRLGARDLIPLFGWALNRGRCRFCAAPIGYRYPLIELAAAAIALWSFAVVPGWLAWATCALGWTLLALGLIDARHLYLPDGLNLPLIPAGLLVAWAVDPAELPSHAAGAAAGFLLVAVLRAAYERWRGLEGIGLGDAKLLAGAGAWLSWHGLPSVLIVASGAALLAYLVRSGVAGRSLKDQEMAFGPFIAGAFWLVWLYGEISLG